MAAAQFVFYVKKAEVKNRDIGVAEKAS